MTHDRFLGGRIVLAQPRDGYRAGIDPVLLAASVMAKPGQSVLELGCGVGAAILCLGARVAGLDLTAVELQPDYAALARQNAETNGQQLTVVTADLRALPLDLRQRAFDHVLVNPPYFERRSSTPAANAGRDIALGGDTSLDAWIDASSRRLKPGGYFTLVQRIARLPELLTCLDGRLGSPVALPVAAREGHAPDLFLLRARKGGRAAFRLLSPLVLHVGDRHLRDAESYRPEVQDVLRNGAALDWPR